MAYEPAGAAEFRQRLLTAPGERREVDYKSSMPFGNDDEFSLKLMKHIQGFANADGGWIVIGLIQTKENDFIPDPAHREEINCWQPAKVGHFRKGEIREIW